MLSEGVVDVDAIVSDGIELAQYPDGVDRLRAGTPRKVLMWPALSG
jgi:hypothetical protein